MNRTRRVLLASLMVALTTAAGYALAGLPNVELVTTLIFVSGFLLGAGLGAAVGAVSWCVHSLFNPLGAAIPPVLAAQVLSGILVGAAGGLLGRRLVNIGSRVWASLAAGVLGLFLTLIFQLLVNTAFFYTFTGDAETTTLYKYLIAGLAFTVTHLVWNAGVFMIVLVPLLSVLDRHRVELNN